MAALRTCEGCRAIMAGQEHLLANVCIRQHMHCCDAAIPTAQNDTSALL